MRWLADVPHTDWLHDVLYPVRFFAVPLAVSLVWPGDLILLIAPVMLLAGYLFTPRHLWMVWLGSLAILWGIQGVAALMGAFASDAENGETVWSVAAESLLFTAVLVLVPLWVGRTLRQLTTRSTTA